MQLQLTKAIGVLDPVLSRGCFRRCGIHINVVEDNVGSVHHVDSPKLRLYHMKVANVDIADVPEHERHRSAWTGCTYSGTFGLVSFVPVPDLAVAIDATRAMTIDAYVIASQNKPGSVVLELDVVVVVPPVFEVFGKLQVEQVSAAVIRYIVLNQGQQTYQPLSSPINVHVVDHGVQSGVDVIRLVGWENYVPSMTTFGEGFKYGWYVICGIGSTRTHSTRGSPTAVGNRDVLC